MPRQTIKIDGWSGGLVNGQSYKNIHDNELAVAINVEIARNGRLSVLGAFETTGSWNINAADIAKIEPGYGLYTFSADYDTLNNYAPDNYLVIAGRNSTAATADKVFGVFNDAGLPVNTTAGDTVVSILASTTAPFYPAMFNVDGALRICDGNFKSTGSSSYWVGYVNNTHFEGTSDNETNWSDWFYRDAALVSPTKGIAGNGLTIIATTTGGSSTEIRFTAASYNTTRVGSYVGHIALVQDVLFMAWDARTVTGVTGSSIIEIDTATGTPLGTAYIYPPQNGVGMNIEFGVIDSTLGSFTTGFYKTGITFLYGEQESNIYEMDGKLEVSAPTNNIAALQPTCLLTEPYDPRMTAIRVYMRKEDSSYLNLIGAGEEWFHVFDVSLRYGIDLADNSGGFLAWQSRTAGGDATAPTDKYVANSLFNVGLVTNLGPDTFRSNTGRDLKTTVISARYKTAVVTNRRAYLGNVYFDGKAYGDAIIKTRPNQFDIHTLDNRLEVVKNDGDEIIKLEEYADRILQFNKKKLYIINVAQNIEFLEGQYDLLGISKPYHSIRTQFGIAWFNERGAYIYDGERIVDLTLDIQDQTRRKIGNVEWQAFIGDDSFVSYLPEEQKLMFFQTNQSNNMDIDCYVFNLTEFAWSFASDKLGIASSTSIYTNPIVDWNQHMLILNQADGHTYVWNRNSTITSTVVVETKEFDFGLPGVNKNLYVVNIRSKNSNGQAVVTYRKDGDSSLFTFTPTKLVASSSWVSTKFVPANSTDAINFKSITVRIDASTEAADFEIDDIQIIYRPKGLR